MKLKHKWSDGSPIANLQSLTSRARRALACCGVLLPAVLLLGCSGIVSGQNSTAPQQSPLTYSISGTISPVAGGSGATVTISGAAGATTTADSAGSYSFTALPNGTYTITPSHVGYKFNPSSQTATVNGANVIGTNFTATAQASTTFSISGTIGPVIGWSGATVTLSGSAGATATSDASGNYSFNGLSNGTYTVTPSHTGYSFNPSGRTVAVSGANVTGINFTATAQQGQTFSISGTISPTAGGGGATVTLSGATTGTTTANSSGAYTFTGLVNGTYAVTPSHIGFTFNPTSRNATVNEANVTGLNFTATAQAGPTFSISGTISPTAGGSAATVILSGAAGATTTTNNAGNYSFAGLANGTYIITPSNVGYTFSPASQNATVSGANLGGVNFTATAQQAHSVALTWNASTSTVAGYNVYRSTVSATQYTRVNTSEVSGLAYVDSTVQSGTTYYYVTTAVDVSGNESTYSNEVSATVP
jgi:Carboxypeptidase regulatory-like domain/CarboxypepD_reg-like domain